MQLEEELSQAQENYEMDLTLKNTAYFRNVFLIALIGVFTIALLLWRNIFLKNRSAKRLDYKNKKLFELNQLIQVQNKEVEGKNDKLSEKNKQVKNSINYAKRLQDAILPTESELAECLPDHGVAYIPKDIVSGDFYWIKQTEDHVFFAVADCTGHGVPGALVSLIGHTALDRCIRELRLTDPGEILNNLSEIVESTFYSKTNSLCDGMDIVLCVWDKKKKITFAGAFNPLYLIREGNLSEIKGNKQPIGKYVHNNKFSSHEIQLRAGDSFYLFTDGYADQFGGERNKKLKYSRFKEYLIELNDKPTEVMRNELIERFENWRGNNDQIDDVCLLNVRF
jgi:serine phosphatase RsbU (regulator of sigma subunit)